MLPAPITKGHVDGGGLAALVRDVVRRLAVGRLDVRGAVGTRHLWYDAGQVRAVVSELEDEKLGAWLVSRGVLEANQMAVTLLRQPDGVRFGAFLVQERLITPEVLNRELEALSVGILSHMLMAPAEWEFCDGEKLPVDAVSLGMTTGSLLAAAVRAVPDERQLRNLTDGQGFVWTTQDALLLYQQLHLTPQEGYLLSRIDGTSTVTKLMQIAPMPAQDFTRALAALSAVGLVEMQPKSATKPLVPTRIEAPPEPKPDSEEALQYTAQEQREYSDVIRLAAEIRHKDFYRRLGLAPGATQDQVHARYLDFVKLYHPDRAREPHLLSLRTELAEIYSTIQEAYDTLGNPERRARYEQTVSSSERVDAFKDEERRRGARSALVDANLKRASELMRAGDVGMAVQLLDQAARLSPTGETLLMLARAEFKNPMWSQRALDHLKHAVALAPDFTEAWVELANFWGARNKLDRQRQCLEKILEYDPTNLDVKLALSAIKRPKGLKKRS
jgi:curved DNA-binding protein CbpA